MTTYADNGITPLRRSRNTGTPAGALGVAPPALHTPRFPLQSVILRLWGLTSQDVETARHFAEMAPGVDLWEIVEEIATHGLPCPIPWQDALVVAQGASYDLAWAVYPAWTLGLPAAS